MADFWREIPTEGLAKIDVELWRGGISVRPAGSGKPGYLQSGWELEVGTNGDTLHVRQPFHVKRPLDLADLIGEQQVRIAVEGNVLLDKQIRHTGADLEIVLPSSVRDVSLRTARGEIRLEGIEAAVEAYTGKGNLLLSGGHGRTVAATADGDVKVSDWYGPLAVRTGKGNLHARGTRGDLDGKTGNGEIRIEEATGRVEVHTGHGSIVASRLSGNANFSTSHGDVVATDLSGGQLEASTGHGRIVVDGSLGGSRIKTKYGEINCRLDASEGEHELQTGKGDISLDLRDGVVARIDASTRNGRISSNLPLVKVGTSGPEGLFNQRMVGTAPGSGRVAQINLSTKYGDVRIIRREGAGVSSPAPVGTTEATAKRETTVADPEVQYTTEVTPRSEGAPVEASPADPLRNQESDIQLEVLGALGRGEISVDEALVLMEKANGS